MAGKTVTLVVVFITFFLLFHYPFIGVMNTVSFVGNIPALFIYLLILWLLLVAISYWIVRNNQSQDDGH